VKFVPVFEHQAAIVGFKDWEFVIAEWLSGFVKGPKRVGRPEGAIGHYIIKPLRTCPHQEQREREREISV
jgi:hypothetical protein